MSRYIDADLIEYHEEYDGQGFTRIAYADDIENLPTVELIDKGRLKFVIEKNFGHGTIEPILQLIDAQPTADVPPVVYGEWIPRQDLIQGEIYDGHRCSNCGAWKNVLEKYNYCPHCGADMRGGTDGGDSI